AVVVGVDPGSKREGFSVRTAAHDLLNVDTDAKDWVGNKLKKRRILRRARRSRKTPCRSPQRSTENHARVPAGTRARWEWKLRILEWLATLYPVTDVVVENINAGPRKGARRWNASFSPLEAGKRWFYGRIEERWQLTTLQGHETAKLREKSGLKKSSHKTSDRWDAHCVDAWVLAEKLLRTGREPQREQMVRITPIQRQRRCLHRANPSKGGDRRPYGGTNKGRWKTGTLVEHPRYGLCYTGGAASGRISLHNLETGKRLTVHARITDCRPRSPLAWRFRFLPVLKDGVSTEQT
ncbi:MAG: RRXRR domain-containing protein, partial [Acidobacteria bacterium]|nr:RRXRR domain-containing protein [Acidobacteriota bacterium]